ncbi:MAG TPA: YceI family protein [Parasegetibacter sp.]
MKNFILALSATCLIVSCQQVPDAHKADAGDAQQAAAATGEAYTIDTASSVIEWIGTKPVAAHHGTIKIAEGTFYLDNNNVTSGNFTIDINSLTDLDMKSGEGKENLENHLKSADFFDVEKFPTGTFVITGSELLANDSTATHQISGNLTLKDSTRNITFPAKIEVADGVVKAFANFNIDRTQWGMYYGNDKSLGDKFIRPEVNIKLNIVANKQ